VITFRVQLGIDLCAVGKRHRGGKRIRRLDACLLGQQDAARFLRRALALVAAGRFASFAFLAELHRDARFLLGPADFGRREILGLRAVEQAHQVKAEHRTVGSIAIVDAQHAIAAEVDPLVDEVARGTQLLEQPLTGTGDRVQDLLEIDREAERQITELWPRE
jgi:hypothetical protein